MNIQPPAGPRSPIQPMKGLWWALRDLLATPCCGTGDLEALLRSIDAPGCRSAAQDVPAGDPESRSDERR